MFTLRQKVSMMVKMGFVTNDNGYLKPVDGVTLLVSGNNKKILVGSKINYIFKHVGGYYFSVGNDCHKLTSDIFVVKHDDDYVNLSLLLFQQSKICRI